MEMQGIPQGEVFQYPWTFIKNEDGTVLLAMVTHGALVPAMVFTKPEALMDFLKSTNKAVMEFIPKIVRDAIEIINRSWTGKEEGGKDDGRGTRVPIPTPEGS